MDNNYSALIKVFNEKNEPLRDVRFFIKKDLRGESRPLKTIGDRALPGYYVTDDLEGEYLLEVTHEGYEPERQQIVFSSRKMVEIVITLVAIGRAYFIEGRSRVPYTPLPEERVYIRFRADLSAAQREELENTLKALGLEEVQERTSDPMLRQYKLSGKRELKEINRQIGSELKKEEGILQIGEVLEQRGEQITMLTEEITVQFKDRATENEIQEFLREYSLEVSRKLPAANLFLLTSTSRTNAELLELCKELQLHPLVETVNPNAESLPELDVTPTNYLAAEQWDHKNLINTPLAWDHLNDDPDRIAKGNTAFGNPAIVISVCDPSGADITHPDLAGNVSGVPKITQVFDFLHMAANMNNPAGSHITCCCSAAASPGNAGQGVAGVAGESRLMPIRIGSGTTSHADMFQWVAGINPQNPNFPPLPANPAHIISNSWGPAGVPFVLPAVVNMSINRITNYGRGGRGTLIFFSAGNNGGVTPKTPCTGNFYERARPYGTHNKAMAVTASTLDDEGKNEVLASYSNYGAGVQFCAPSNDGCEGLHNPPANYGAFTATHRPNAANPITSTSVDAINAPSRSILVSNAGFIDDRSNVVVGPPGNARSERHRVTNVVGNTLTFQIPWATAPQIGDPVVFVDGNCPGGNTVSDTLTGPATDGNFNIHVNDPTLYSADRAVMINPGLPTAEAHAILRVNVATKTVTLTTPVLNPATVDNNTKVDVGSADYRNNFGGTSYATPVCAGLAALCLAANNLLSWVEVRHIMRTSGNKINIGEKGVSKSGVNIGKWRDANGQDVVNDKGALIPLPSPVSTSLSALNGDRTVASLDSIAGFALGHSVVFIGGGKSEFREIIFIGADSITLDLPLVHIYPTPGTTVQVGRKPRYSAFYGFGRVHAARAVKAALDSVANYRQLVIRHNLADNGTAVTDNIHSPDIWVTNAALPTSGAVYNLKRVAVGLDDFSFQQNFNGQQNAEFYIEIDKTGVKDTFRWSFNDTVIGNGIPITGAPQVLVVGALNFSIQFGVVTGHKLSDNWTVFIDFTETALDYTKDAPHENPKTGNNRFVHARIKNLVTGPEAAQFKNLDTWVRFYIALSDGQAPGAAMQPPGFTSNFFFSSNGNNNDWTDSNAIANITSGTPQTYFLGEVEVPEGVIDPADNADPSKNNYIVSIPWNMAHIPPAGTPQGIYLLTHISPFHGPLAGTGAHNNSCLSYREIAFADFTFMDQPRVKALVKKLEVDLFGSAVNETYSADITFQAGSFTTEKVTLEAIRLNDNGTEEKALFMHNGAAWVFDAANPQWSGLTVNAPVITTTLAAATGIQTQVSFQGNFNVGKENQRVTFRLKIVSSNSTQVIAATEHVIEVAEQGDMSTDPASLVALPPPVSYAFADMSLVTQGAAQAYGPVSGQEPSKFRVTNLFTAAQETRAYAITSGVCFLQPGALANTVNLVLRPFKQTVINFTPVKYFVYRGLRKDDFLDMVDETKILASNPSNSEFIKRQREIHTAQNAPGTDFLSKSMGYDAASQPASDSLDTYFFRNDPGFQLPFANKGMQLGRFHHSGGSQFGIDILLEEGANRADLAYVRKASHEIDVTGLPSGTDAEKLQKKMKREEILNYLDIAPFYGMHLLHKGTVEIRKVSDGSTEKKTGQDIYTEVVSRFHTKNRVYLDLRNETGNSYNFFGNYKAGAAEPNPGTNIRVGTEYTDSSANNLAAQTYQVNEWPVLFEDRVQNVTGDTNLLVFSLRFDDNQNPMLYVEEGVAAGAFVVGTPPFFDSADLGVSLQNAVWTRALGFALPNTGASGTKSNVSTIIKVLYGRAIKDPAPAWPDTVLRTETALDNVFGPLQFDIPWQSEKTFKWTTAQDKKYIDLGGTWGYLAGRGVSQLAFNDADPNAGRVIFFAVAADYYKPPADFQNTQGITGGVSSKATFFEAAPFLRDLRLSFDHLIIAGVKIITLQLLPAGPGALTANSLLLLCISRQELEALKVLQGFQAQYPRYVKLEQVAATPDDKGKAYKKFKLKVQGLDDNGKYKLSQPAQDTFVYSVDDYLYFSDAYSKDEPVASTYTRDAEEFVGTQKNAAVANKAWEDFFVDLDTKGAIGGIADKAQKIVQDFTDAVKAVANNANSKANLQTHVDNFSISLLNRLRAFAADAGNNNADDRILYWARIKMKVALQSHEFMLQSFQERNELLKRFEAKSRGYDSINFAPATAGVKKILVTGFDPYFLDPRGGLTHNVRNSNPSGGAALALHGKFITNGANQVGYVQSVILPVRFADLDRNGGEGIAEEYLAKFIDPAANGYTPVDLIIVMDKAVPRSFMFGRFAARRRGVQKDNQFQHSAQIPPLIPGNQFYETTLQAEKAVPNGPYPTGQDYYRYFTQTYEYRIQATNTVKRFAQQKQEGKAKINNNPDGSDPANLLPVNQPQADITALQGSFGYYFANEIFYRLSALRQKKNGTVNIGLLMLPRLQGTSAEAVADAKVKTDFNGVLTKEVIDRLKLLLKDLVV